MKTLVLPRVAIALLALTVASLGASLGVGCGRKGGDRKTLQNKGSDPVSTRRSRGGTG